MKSTGKAHARGQNAKQVRAPTSTKFHARESPKTGDSARRFEWRQSREMEVSAKSTGKAHARGQNAKQVRAPTSTKFHARESPKTGDSARRFEWRQSREMEVSVKNIVMIMVSVTLGVLTMGMIFAVSGRMNRSVEVKSNLSSAAEQTVDGLIREDGSIPYGNEEMLADFIGQIVMANDTVSDLVVEVGALDAKKGLLSVRVVEQFVYPNGKRGSTESSRTVIWDKPFTNKN